jgi:2,4-dienoyl-CoA reductase-like NADH-dependent reductase (Old Yellow Enzyme family)
VDIGAQVDDLDRLIRMMERDAFDLVAIGRAILSDPDWPHKVQRGEIDRIRPFSRENIETYM